MLVNVHLISDHARDATQRRLQELAAIGKQFATEDDIILLGDFNFGDNDMEENTVPWGAFLDCWHILHGSEPGYTVDVEKNPLTKFTCTVRKESRRLDRIKMRGLLVPRDIHVFADTPHEGLYPSDHYAVRAVIVQEDAFVPFLPTVSLDQQCAIVILPPPHIWESIDEMRKLHDKACPRWMPHVNLLHPFVQLSGEQSTIVPRALAAIATRFVPFRVRLRDFHYNPCHSRSWLHLIAEALPPFESSMYRLYTMLASTYTMCARDNFAPHLTVGQFASAEVDKARAQFLVSWKPVVFDVTHIHIIARNSRDDSMNVIHSIPLGSFTEPPVFPAPLDVFPKRAVSGDIPSEPLDPPPMVMEPVRWGNRALEPYWPKDALETWMLSVSAMEYARTCPTHISQRGGMYHIPANLLGTYLQKWEESIKESDKVPFFIEEIRGDIFRLYVDVDFKSTSHSKIELEKTGFVPVLLTHTAACFPGANLAVCITDCHGKWDDKHHTDAVYKSGYRFYFQHIFVDQTILRSYLDSLARVCEELLTMMPEAPRSVTWPEVVDTHSAIWDRGRLIGTIKRRKNLWRRYRLLVFVTATGDVEKFIEKRGKDTVLKVMPAPEYTEAAKSSLAKLLFATTMRLWETDNAPQALLHDNVCTDDATYLQGRVNEVYMQPLLQKDRRRLPSQPQPSPSRENSEIMTPTTPKPE
jgi:2'-5' RNA ligase